jgi:hypothetical protein
MREYRENAVREDARIASNAFLLAWVGKGSPRQGYLPGALAPFGL